jgi:hypothetical protein
VVTPAVYTPGASFKVTVGSTTVTQQASGAGTLTIDVPLGPSNMVQEYPLDLGPIGTKVYTTHVTVAPASP